MQRDLENLSRDPNMNVKYIITIEIEMKEKTPDWRKWKDIEIIGMDPPKIFDIKNFNITSLVKNLEIVCKKYLIKGDKAEFNVDVSEISLKDDLN